jgi:beta-mannosidase
MDIHRGQADVDLSGAWQFAFHLGAPGADYTRAQDLAKAGLEVRPCRVPGNLELDLQDNGLVGEPFYGLNVLDLTRYERAHAWYFRRFKADARPGHNAQIVFEGIDCYAEIYLNGRKLGSTDNMLVEHVFDVDGLLAAENELLVHIRPAADEAGKYEYPPLTEGVMSITDSLYVRKAPHMYGWDIMPRAISCGLWRPVRLRHLPVERIEDVFLETRSLTADRRHAQLSMHYRVRTQDSPTDPYELEVEGVCGDSRFSRRHRLTFVAGKIRIGVDEPRLWWPRGRGEPNLYDVTVRLLKAGRKVHEVRFHHGIRTVELRRTEVTRGGDGEFCFVINGEKVFVLGSNWVPADAYHSRDAARIPRMLELAADVGCNMLRCWGGNVYEDDLFYDICDRKGIMIWQDWTMACALYPQDEAFCKRLEAEAVKVVRRLRQHPSIVLWCGDNECDAAYIWWKTGKDPNQNVLTRKVIPGVLHQYDAGRPYLPSSPYISPEAYRAGVDDVLPENHLWGPRNYYKSPFYLNSTCHFASEIGYFGCPSPASLRKFLSPQALWPWQDNKEWNLHSTEPVPSATDSYGDMRVRQTANQVRELFGAIPESLEDFALASQASQAEAKKFFIEFFRASKWRRTGIIWWNLIDGWPQISDAVVDYYFEKKLAWYCIRRAQQPVCLMFREPAGWFQELVAVNDTRNDVEVTYRVRDVDTGQVLVEGRRVAVADGVTVLGKVPYSATAKRFYLIEWEGPRGKGVNHYMAGNPPFDLATYKRWMMAAGFGEELP